MSSNNSKKSKLTGEDLEKEKSRVVYERLKRAYFEPGERSDENLGERFGNISKQAIGQRKKSGNWDPQEIIDLFPDVNYDWVFSDDLHDLRTLPVRKIDAEPQHADSIDKSEAGLSDQTRQELVEEILKIAQILKDSF